MKGMTPDEKLIELDSQLEKATKIYCLKTFIYMIICLSSLLFSQMVGLMIIFLSSLCWWYTYSKFHDFRSFILDYQEFINNFKPQLTKNKIKMVQHENK